MVITLALGKMRCVLQRTPESRVKGESLEENRVALPGPIPMPGCAGPTTRVGKESGFTEGAGWDLGRRRLPGARPERFGHRLVRACLAGQCSGSQEPRRVPRGK